MPVRPPSVRVSPGSRGPPQKITREGRSVYVTFHRAAGAASGSGPAVILPCVVRSPGPAAAGASPADDTCDSGVITCNVTADDPSYSANTKGLIFFAKTTCSDDVDQIRMGQDVIHSTRPVCR